MSYVVTSYNTFVPHKLQPRRNTFPPKGLQQLSQTYYKDPEQAGALLLLLV